MKFDCRLIVSPRCCLLLARNFLLIFVSSTICLFTLTFQMRIPLQTVIYFEKKKTKTQKIHFFGFSLFVWWFWTKTHIAADGRLPEASFDDEHASQSTLLCKCVEHLTYLFARVKFCMLFIGLFRCRNYYSKYTISFILCTEQTWQQHVACMQFEYEICFVANIATCKYLKQFRYKVYSFSRSMRHHECFDNIVRS